MSNQYTLCTSTPFVFPSNVFVYNKNCWRQNKSCSVALFYSCLQWSKHTCTTKAYCSQAAKAEALASPYKLTRNVWNLYVYFFFTWLLGLVLESFVSSKHFAIFLITQLNQSLSWPWKRRIGNRSLSYKVTRCVCVSFANQILCWFLQLSNQSGWRCFRYPIIGNEINRALPHVTFPAHVSRAFRRLRVRFECSIIFYPREFYSN